MKLNDKQIADLERDYRTIFVNSLTGFKSANLIGSYDENRRSNLSIFSSLFHLGAYPALIGMVSRPNSVPRDTIENIKSTGFYSINHVNTEIYKQAHQTSARYQPGTSEFDEVGLTREYYDDFSAPFVKECRIQLGVEYKTTMNVELNNTDIIIGEIVFVNIKDDIVSHDGFVDIESARSVTVSSLDSYHVTQVIDSLEYAKPDSKPVSTRQSRFRK